MICPICNKWAMTKEARYRKTGGYTYRRYECGNEHRFTTREFVVLEDSAKHDAMRQEIGSATGKIAYLAQLYGVSEQVVSRCRAYVKAANYNPSKEHL